MKWLFIGLFWIVLARSAEIRCSVFEFQSLMLMTHDLSERHKLALQWLGQNGSKCSVEKLIFIQNHRAEWLGNADSIQIQNVINRLLEK